MNDNCFKFLIFSWIIIISFSCVKKVSNTAIIPICDSTLTLDTTNFEKQIINKRGRILQNFIYVQDLIKRAGIKSYDNGYDSISVRLFYDGRKNDKPQTQVMQIRKNCEGWIGEYNLIDYYDENEKFKINVKKRYFSFPNSDWKEFTTKIFNLGITTLPDWSEVPSYNPANDGDMLVIEISTKTYYRLYTYLQPDIDRNIKEVLKIRKILSLFENEFGIEWN